MSQILIVDDDPTIRLTLSRLLKGQGFDVAIAKDGREGLAKALELRPALIICDWMMPVMDGLQVCAAVRQAPLLVNTYFILLTSRDQEEDIVQGLEAGADDFLPKPPRSGELKARVRAGLRVYNANYELQRQKELLEQELAQAGQYVRSLLPEELNSSVITHSRFIPSAQLGGDCFDFFWIDPDQLFIYLLDVSGHGVGPALLSVSVLNLLRTKCLNPSTEKLLRPKEILQDLNQSFQMSGHSEMYFTIWLGIYSKSSGVLDFSSAGHPPAFLHQAEGIKRLKTKGIPVAMLPDVEYQQGSCQVQSGDRLYIFSDGAYEIELPEGGIVGLANLEQMITECSDDNCIVDQVIEKLRNLAQVDKFEDDFSILEIKF